VRLSCGVIAPSIVSWSLWHAVKAIVESIANIMEAVLILFFIFIIINYF